MWWMYAKAAAAAGQAYLGSAVTNANVAAANKVGRANAQASNMTRVASNRFAAAAAAFQRWQQGENNRRQLDAMGEALADNAGNFVRQDDARTASNFEQSVRDAEEQGAQAAAAGAAGLFGGSVDQINSATALRRSRANQFNRDMGDYARYDAGKRAGSLLQQGVQGLDSSIVFDGIDYNNNVYSDKAKVKTWAQVAMSIGDSLVGSMTAQAATGSTASTGPTDSKYSLASAGNVRLGGSTGSSLFSASESSRSSSFGFSTQSNPYSLGSARLGG